MTVWLGALAVPLAGLALVLAKPGLDRHWEDHPAHFWLVVSVAAISVGLGLLTGEAARRLDDARLFLVSMAFVSSAAFLGLHALATPGVLLEGKNAGFVIATPVGLAVAGLFAAASATDLERHGAAVMRRRVLIRNGLVAVIAAWAVISLLGLPPLDRPLPPEEAEGPLYAIAAAGLVLYAYAAIRYLALYRREPSPLLLTVVAAWVLLAEAMLAIAAARNWHLSWWEWHVLMAIAFGLVAVAARTEYRRGRSPFGGLYLQETVARLDERYRSAIEDRLEGKPVPGSLTETEAQVVDRAAAEVRRLDDLFRPYLSPQLAARIREDPRAARLGGESREVSVLFADLAGFTTYSEQHDPAEVLQMLNEYWARAVPAVAAEGGVVERFAGDAVMVVFNAAEEQPDHARRAARAALALQDAVRDLAQTRPGWPRLRAGVNSGPALVGNVGSAEQRSFAAIGDTTNVAARLQGAAAPGQVVIAEATLSALGDGAVTEPLPPLALKGKRDPVEAHLLTSLSR